MHTPKRQILFAVALASVLAIPIPALAADAELTEHLEFLSRNGRWEQVLEMIERAGPGDPDLAPYKARAEKELPNLYKFLRVRNAHKRQDFGTAILVARGIEADSVYRARADGFVDKSMKRYGPEETNRAARSAGETNVKAQLGLVLDLRPDFKPAQRVLEEPVRVAAPEPAEVMDGPEMVETPEVAEAPPMDQKVEPKAADAAEEPALQDAPESPPMASAGTVVSLDELGKAPEQPSSADAVAAVTAGRAAADKGDLDGAAEKLRDAVAIDASHAPAYLHLGVVEHARGNRKDAVDAFKHFLRLAPDDPKAAQLLAYVRDNDAKKAGPDARQCMAEASKASGEGNLEGAIAWLHKAAVADPEMPEPWLQLGMMLERVGRADNARKAYGRYLELAPEGAFAQNARAGIDRLK